jgi:hypothetical protein
MPLVPIVNDVQVSVNPARFNATVYVACTDLIKTVLPRVAEDSSDNILSAPGRE